MNVPHPAGPEGRPHKPAAEGDTTRLFRSNWGLYDGLAAANYMFHREIYGEVARLLGERHARGPYSLIDLGCGNARFLAPCLTPRPPRAYTGVDLSGPALDEARRMLADLSGVELVESDMLARLESDPGGRDVVFSGYALHHLDSDRKRRFFAAAFRSLTPGGMMILVDVARAPGEERAAYIAGYLRMMREEWTAIDRAQVEQACAHVAAHDFPETVADLEAVARDGGFGSVRLLCRHRQHHLWVMERD